MDEQNPDGITAYHGSLPNIELTKDDENNKLIAKAIDDWNHPIGYATFNIGDNNELDPQHVEVAKAHRSKGIAKNLYDHVASRGFKIIRSSDQTEDGEAFWNKHQGPNSKIWRNKQIVHKDNGGPITAYHGSPHEFEKFDTSKIGTGEGAQAYGHGLYFAESEPVAEGYRERLGKTSETSGETMADQFAIPHNLYKFMDENDISDHLEDINRYAEHKIFDQGKMKYVFPDGSMVVHEDDHIRPIQKQPGHMYEVHIDAHPDHFLDWDKPAKDQHPHILNAIAPLFPDGIPETKKYGETFRGGDLYDLMKQRLGGLMYKKLADEAGIPPRLPGGTDERLSKYLSSQGVHGIKYFDQVSRDRGGGTRNYVVFDHNRVNIKRRYAEGGEVEREGFGFGGDTVGAGSRPERGATGSASAARAAREAPQPSYRDMPAELQQAQRDLSFKNEQVINAMKESNAAEKQRKAEQMTAWAGAGFPAGGPASMQVGEETRPTAYAMSDISKKSPVMQSQADIIASLAPPPQHYESSVAGNQIAYAPMPQHYESSVAGNQIAAAPMPQHYEPTFAQNRIDPAPQQVAFKQPARPISPTPVNKPIQLAALDSSTFKPASPMPDFQPQTQDRGPRRRLVKKLMPDGTYQDVWEEYAHGGVAKSYATPHNSAIIEHALGKVGAPPPAFGQSLSVAKRGRPL